MLTFFVVSNAQATSNSTATTDLSSLNRDRLNYSVKVLKEYLGKKEYELGDTTIEVKGPDELVKTKEGTYYTGRIMIKRWGTNLDQPIASYQWNMDHGERWWCGREMIFWQEDLGGWKRFIQGPNMSSDFPGNQYSRVEIQGEAPDWSLFPGHNYTANDSLFK